MKGTALLLPLEDRLRLSGEYEIVKVDALYHLDKRGELTIKAPDVGALLRRKDCRPEG